MLTIFDKSFEPTTTFKDKLTYLNGTNFLMSFRTNPNELQNVTVKIKLMLGSGQTRLEGLALLKTVLAQCSQEVFSSNAISWAQSTIAVLKSTDSCVCKDLAFSILSGISASLTHCPGLRADVANLLFPSLIPILLLNTSEDEWISSAINCLAVCMKSFPGLLGAYKSGIEEFLLQQLDTLITQRTEVVADCFAELPACGERGSNPKVYRENWLEQFYQILNTLHSILNDFHLDTNDGLQKANYLCTTDNCELHLPPPPEDPFSCILLQARQFAAISRCLAKMMSSASRHTVQMPIEPILAILYRILSISAANMKDISSPESQLIISLLPAMQCAAFVVLESLILCCHVYLINYFGFIGRLFVHSLKTSKENIFPISSLLRCTVYKVLKIWVNRLGAKGSLEVLKNHFIIRELLCDIMLDGSYKEPTDNRGTVTLNPTTKDKMANVDALSNKNFDDPNSAACIQALKVLSSIIYIGGPFLEIKILEDIQKNVLSILNEIQYRQPIPSLYSNERCRKKLYGLLLAIVINPNRHLKQPLQQSVRIFKVGLRDPSVHVSGFCHRAFSVCNTTLHPRKVVSQLFSDEKENSENAHELLNDGRLLREVDSEHNWKLNDDNGNFTQAEKLQQIKGHKMENSHMPPLSNVLPMESVSVVNYSKHGDGCNGNDNIRNSSHEDNESIDEESEEDGDEEERSFCEEMDNGLPNLSESSAYAPPRTSVSYHASLENNQLLHPVSPTHDYDELGVENNLIKARGDCSSTSVNQNGLYDSSEDDDVEDDVELENEYIVSKAQKKRTSEHSFDIPSKKQCSMNADEESEDEEDIDEAEEQNAVEMIQDFMPCSPDESQS